METNYKLCFSKPPIVPPLPSIASVSVFRHLALFLNTQERDQLPMICRSWKWVAVELRAINPLWKRWIQLEFPLLLPHVKKIGKALGCSPQTALPKNAYHALYHGLRFPRERKRFISTALLRSKKVYLAFSPDMRAIVAQSEDWKTYVYMHSRGKWRASELLKGNHAEINTIALSSDKCSIATGSIGGVVNIWNTYKGSWKVTAQLPQESFTHSIAFSPSGSSLLVGSGDTISLWNQFKSQWEKNAVFAGSSFVALSPTGRFIATDGDPHSVLIYSQSDSGWQRSAVLEGHTQSVTNAIFSADEDLITTSCDHTARVWGQFEKGWEVTAVLKGHRDGVISATFSHHKRFILTGSADHTARLWKKVEGSWVTMAIFNAKDPIQQVAFSRDDCALFTASDRGGRLWSIHPRLSNRLTLLQRKAKKEKLPTLKDLSRDELLLISKWLSSTEKRLYYAVAKRFRQLRPHS